jgi:hypothetical protein
MGFTTLTLVLSGYKLEASREDNYAEPITLNKGKMFVLQVLLC